jgi:hypothetical protein
MDSFSTAHTRPPPHHRGRGTFKNRTWVAGDRSGSSSPFQPQAGHLLGADAPRWERGGGRGRGRGKGRSPKPEFGSSLQRNGGDVSEVEGEGDDAEVAAAVDGAGAEPGPTDEPVLDTLEERERFYQEVSPRHSCRFLFCFPRLDLHKPWQTRVARLIFLAR